MKWSRGPKLIFDGGAIGRDSVNVVHGDRTDDPDFQIFSYQDARALLGVPDTSGSPVPSSQRPSAQPPAAMPQPSPATAAPTVNADEVARREQEAFERGRAEGQSAVDAHLARLTAQLEGAVEFFHTTLSQVDAQASKQSLELALMIAEQLFRKAVEADPDRLLAAVEELIGEADQAGEIRIVVDPVTEKQWRANGEALKELLSDRSFEVEAKPELSIGDLIVHCGSQTLDERLANRVRQYARALENELGLSGGD